MASISAVPTIAGNIERSDIGRRYVEAAVRSGMGGIVSRVLQGLAGGALILFALGFVFWLAFWNLPEPLTHPAEWVQFAALGCCGLLVRTFVDSNLHVPVNAAWFAVLLGLYGSANG